MKTNRPEPMPHMREYCRMIEDVEKKQYGASVGMLICILAILALCIAAAVVLL